MVQALGITPITPNIPAVISMNGFHALVGGWAANHSPLTRRSLSTAAWVPCRWASDGIEHTERRGGVGPFDDDRWGDWRRLLRRCDCGRVCWTPRRELTTLSNQRLTRCARIGGGVY